jgi:hypothetical protein
MFRLNGLVREYRCHIIGQTHTGKNPKSGTFGSIAWENHANTVLRLSCDAHDIRTLVVGKSRVTKRGRIIGHAAIEAAAINVPFIRELENGPAAGLDDTRAAPQSERSARPGQVSVSRSNKGGRAKPLRPATQADRDDARLHDALAPMALLDVIRLDDGSEAVPWRNVHDAFIDGLDGSQDRGNQSRRWKEALLRAGIEPQPVQHDGKRFLKLPAARL